MVAGEQPAEVRSLHAAALGGGIILLGWLGGSNLGGTTDVFGHVFGFTSGLFAGLGIGSLTPATAETK